MTAEGYLFMDEYVRDEVEEELDKKLGPKNWALAIPDKYNHIWDLSEMPSMDEIPIVDGKAYAEKDEEKRLGQVNVFLKFEIKMTDMGERYIEPELEKFDVIINGEK